MLKRPLQHSIAPRNDGYSLQTPTERVASILSLASQQYRRILPSLVIVFAGAAVAFGLWKQNDWGTLERADGAGWLLGASFGLVYGILTAPARSPGPRIRRKGWFSQELMTWLLLICASYLLYAPVSLLQSLAAAWIPHVKGNLELVTRVIASSLFFLNALVSVFFLLLLWTMNRIR